MPDIKTKLVPPEDDDNKLWEALKQTCAVVPNMDAIRILAITSKWVGALIAVQDRRKYGNDPKIIMEIIIQNIQKGNLDAIEDAFRGADPSKPS